MLGLGSIEIALVFWLCLAAALGCVVYGIVNWNNRGNEAVPSCAEDVLDNKGAGK